MNALQQLRRRLLVWLDQLFMILNLPTLTTDLEGRMRRLRRIYYHNPQTTIAHGRVRDILHGHVDKRYRPLYERLLSTERSIYTLSQQLPASVDAKTILFQSELLGEKLAALIEDLQSIDHQLRQGTRASLTNTTHLTQQQLLIKKRLERGLERQSQIPVRLQTLVIARSDPDTQRLTAEIERLTQFAVDVAESYDEIRDEDSNEPLEMSDNAQN